MVQLREEARRTAAPDQLGSYIKVSRPSVWMLIAVIVALLVAGVAWFLAGTVNESVSAPCVAEQDSCVAYIPLSRSAEVKPGDAVVLTSGDGDVQGSVEVVGQTPVSVEQIEAVCGSDGLAGFSQDSWGIAVALDVTASPGAYDARIITASHRPIRLLLGLD